jgi:hypothetical protein
MLSAPSFSILPSTVFSDSCAARATLPHTLGCHAASLSFAQLRSASPSCTSCDSFAAIHMNAPHLFACPPNCLLMASSNHMGRDHIPPDVKHHSQSPLSGPQPLFTFNTCRMSPVRAWALSIWTDASLQTWGL